MVDVIILALVFLMATLPFHLGYYVVRRKHVAHQALPVAALWGVPAVFIGFALASGAITLLVVHDNSIAGIIYPFLAGAAAPLLLLTHPHELVFITTYVYVLLLITRAVVASLLGERAFT